MLQYTGKQVIFTLGRSKATITWMANLRKATQSLNQGITTLQYLRHADQLLVAESIHKDGSKTFLWKLNEGRQYN